MNKWVFSTDELIQKCQEKINEIKDVTYYPDDVKLVITKQWLDEIERLENNRNKRGEP